MLKAAPARPNLKAKPKLAGMMGPVRRRPEAKLKLTKVKVLVRLSPEAKREMPARPSPARPKSRLPPKPSRRQVSRRRPRPEAFFYLYLIRVHQNISFHPRGV